MDSMDCGPACLRAVAAHHGRQYSLQVLREYCHADREGVSLLGIARGAERVGLECVALQVPLHGDADAPGLDNIPLPCIVHWQQRHFVVVYALSSRWVWLVDPALGYRRLRHDEFTEYWYGEGQSGIALVLEPRADFYERAAEPVDYAGWRYLLGFLRPYRNLVVQLLLGLLLGSVLQLLFPFLMQSVVDVGIGNQDLGFITLVLLAQLMIFLGQMSVAYLRSWILLHIGTRVNVALLAGFLRKLMRLPIGFFDSKTTGDLLQRIDDHRRVEQFLAGTSLTTLFSLLNLLVFGLVLWWYNGQIFLVFALSALLYGAWVLLFMERRVQIDQLRFEHLAEHQNTLLELLQGMPDIKLHQSEQRHRMRWLDVQVRLFRTHMKSLALAQQQDIGSAAISQLKDIVITFLAAYAVVEGRMTLGMMLAVQYITGQLNGPLQQFVHFVRNAQDAKTSMARMAEIHEMPDESAAGAQPMAALPPAADLRLEGVSFRYNALSEDVLKGLSLRIPQGRVTAIVGSSGSGKTTLVKLLMGFYAPTEGRIYVGDVPLEELGWPLWRRHCGAVLQDGYIFSDSIASNIAESAQGGIDQARLARAAAVAQVGEFVNRLPLGYGTQVGNMGNGLSQGQRQRLLIARAVYKDPAYLFLDEATNALDALNERAILENLSGFAAGRTVVVVAHRLSTVRLADQIVVMAGGGVAELGTHVELLALRGVYYHLVREQLEG